jgi:F0F1-type ATP synthase assembly protein I
LPGAVAFLSMGLSAAVCVGLGLLLGILVDGALHTAPAFLLVGLALGLALAAMSVVKQIRTFL